jgi:large subunit ribosomal protein L23
MTTIYEVLRRPLVTEKTSYQSGKLNQYTFEVANDATKTMVKDAVEQLLDVKVLGVNIINTAAKRGRRAKSRRLTVRRAGYKKAVITLAPGETLEMFEGVK